LRIVAEGKCGNSSTAVAGTVAGAVRFLAKAITLKPEPGQLSGFQLGGFCTGVYGASVAACLGRCFVRTGEASTNFKR
jgi:hypothetical protein